MAKSKPHKSIVSMVFNKGLLHAMKEAFDETARRIVRRH
jgi:hypothetical protein